MAIWRLVFFCGLFWQAVTPLAAQDRPVFVHEHFTFEILSVEQTGKDIKITFLYTNREKHAHFACIHNKENGARNIAENYMIDDLGYRYGYKSGEDMIHGSTYPPGIPVRASFTFGGIDRRITKFAFAIFWSYHSSGWKRIPIFFKDLFPNDDGGGFSD